MVSWVSHKIWPLQRTEHTWEVPLPVFKWCIINPFPAKQILWAIGCVFAFRICVTQKGLQEWEEASTGKVSRCKVTWNLKQTIVTSLWHVPGKEKRCSNLVLEITFWIMTVWVPYVPKELKYHEIFFLGFILRKWLQECFLECFKNKPQCIHIIKDNAANKNVK